MDDNTPEDWTDWSAEERFTTGHTHYPADFGRGSYTFIQSVGPVEDKDVFCPEGNATVTWIRNSPHIETFYQYAGCMEAALADPMLYYETLDWEGTP